MLAGLVIGLFPLVLAVPLSIGCQDPSNESSCAGAVAYSFSTLTLPLASTGSNAFDYWVLAAGPLALGLVLVLLGHLRRRSRIHN
jgi:hypothetical protein